MNYRFQELLRLVIPGIYLLVLSTLLLILTESIEWSENSGLIPLLKSPFSNLLVMLIPVLGLIVGYVTNILASMTERFAYKKSLCKRASAIVLGFDTDYLVDNLNKIKDEFSVNEIKPILVIRLFN